MKEIGGFFELEIPSSGGTYHPDALTLSAGRGCIAVVLEVMKPRLVRLPFYACDALIAPVQEAGVKIEFYRIDKRLRPVDLPLLRSNELFVGINYFGLCSSAIAGLAKRFRRCFVADHAQAFFEKPVSGSWTFYSARKFFGVPDGAYLYSPMPIEPRWPQNPNLDIRHLVNRLAGERQIAFRQMQRFEEKIDNQIRRMSIFSERLISTIDYATARRRRLENYRFLNRELGQENLFDATLPTGAVPFCYPLLLNRPINRRALAKEHLYVPTLWKDVVRRRATGFEWEREFARNLLPLPIDHRYSLDDMAEALRRLRTVAARV